jgi:hypothetical protein
MKLRSMRERSRRGEKLKLRRKRLETRTRGRFLQSILTILPGVLGTQGKNMLYGLVRRQRLVKQLLL